MRAKTRNAFSASKSAHKSSQASRRRRGSLKDASSRMNARAVAGSVVARRGLRATRRKSAHSAAAVGSSAGFADAAAGLAAIAVRGPSGVAAIRAEGGTAGAGFIAGGGISGEGGAQNEALGLSGAPQGGALNGVRSAAQARRGELPGQPRGADGDAHGNTRGSRSCAFSRHFFTRPANLLVPTGASRPRLAQ